MKIDATHNGQAGHVKTKLDCPHCRVRGLFEPLGQHDVQVDNLGTACGQRKCPNPECNGHVFVINRQAELIASYPPSRIDFNTESIPASIVSTFEEVITCEANDCYVASAIMVRRTLEEICADQGATGNNLQKRIEDLSTKIVIPKELKDAMTELRLLGNDAAHVEAKDYDKISDEELSVAIEFAKELLKSIYQYKSLLGRLIGLKKPAAP